MFDSMLPKKGWLCGHPFFLLTLFALSCSQAPPPVPMAAIPSTPACGAPALAATSRLTFTEAPSGLPRSGQWRDDFDLADMNGDGELDLVHGPSRKGHPWPAIFLGNGKGTFILWKTAHYPPLPYDYGDAKAADFNRDGLMDLALSAHLRGLTVLLQEGDGHFAPYGSGLTMRLPAGDQSPNLTSRAIATPDWNRDGLPDLLALNEGPTRLGPTPPQDSLALYLNRGGEWHRVAEAGPDGVFGTSLATGDANGDGHADAIIGTNVGGAGALLQLGNGGGMISRDLASLPANATVSAVAMSDLDRDRRDEILSATIFLENENACIALDVIRLDDEKDTASRIFGERSRDVIVSLISADLDGDGRTDLLAVRKSGAMLPFLATETGHTREPVVPAPEAMVGCDAYGAHVADLDHDASPEVIVSYAGDLTAGPNLPCRSGGGFVLWRITTRP